MFLSPQQISSPSTYIVFTMGTNNTGVPETSKKAINKKPEIKPKKPVNYRERCCYGGCTNNQKSKDPNLKYIPFPKPCPTFVAQLVKDLCKKDVAHFDRHKVENCQRCSKSLRWIQLCKCDDGRLRALEDITKHTYICNKHFASGNGPTVEHPDPLPASVSESSSVKRKYVKKLRPANAHPVKRQKFDAAQEQLKDTKLQPESKLTEETVSGSGNVNAVGSSNTKTGLACQQMSQALLSFTASCVGTGWTCEYDEDGSNFYATDFTESSEDQCGNRVFHVQVSVTKLLKSRVFVFGEEIPVSEPVGEQANRVSSIEELNQLLDTLQTSNLCKGISEENCITAFKQLTGSSRGKICEHTGAVRSKTCALIAKGDRCPACITYSHTLKNSVQQQELPNKNLSKFCNNKYLTKQQMDSRTAASRENTKVWKKRYGTLLTKVKKAVNYGHQVCPEDNKDLSDILFKFSLDTEKNITIRTFLNEQRKAAAKESVDGYRWAAEMIKYCLRAKLDEETGVITLQSDRKLYRYVTDLVEVPDFPKTLPEELTESLDSLEIHQKYFSLIFEEIKVSDGLVYRKSTGELVGYVNLDDKLNTELQIETTCEDKYLLQFMVQGLTSNIKFLYEYIPISNLTANELYVLVTDAISSLELRFGIKILTVRCESTIVNRNFFRLAAGNEMDDDIPFCMQNYYAVDQKRVIYFIPDPVDVLKRVRNSFANSGCHAKCKLLWRNGQNINWEHVLRTYKNDLRSKNRTLNKLTDSHMFLRGFGKINSKYAVEVMSESVAAAVRQLHGEKCAETVKFISTFNKLFDIINVWNLQEENLNFDPYMSVMDHRLLWLEEDFIEYLENWEEDVAMREGNFTDVDRRKMLLADYILEALRMLSKSVPAVIRFLLEKGAEFGQSGKMDEDQVELQLVENAYFTECNEGTSLLNQL